VFIAGSVVGEGKSAATLAGFFDALGVERSRRLQTASMDMHGAYAKVTRGWLTSTELLPLRVEVIIGGIHLTGLRYGRGCAAAAPGGLALPEVHWGVPVLVRD